MTDLSLALSDAERAYDLDRRHVFHSWSAHGALDPMVVTKADGSHVWDAQGHRLLDFTSQLVFTNMGHQHPRIVAAIQEQAAALCTVAPAAANGTRSEAARLIAAHTPGDLDRCSSPTVARTPTSTPFGWPGCTPADPRCFRGIAPTTAAPSSPST